MANRNSGNRCDVESCETESPAASWPEIGALTLRIRRAASRCLRILLGLVLFSFPTSAVQNNVYGDAVRVVWQTQQSGVDVSLRGISVVNDAVAWASGADGTVLRTEDAGETWTDVSIAVAQKFDFRDIEGFSKEEAVVLSAGSPAKAFRTSDAGKNWREVFRDDRPAIFFDGMAFFDAQRGIAFSDPIAGRLVMMSTDDAGRSWRLSAPSKCPKLRRGEAGFAASGTAMTLLGELAWIGLGGAGSDDSKARIFRSTDSGITWESTTTPLRSGESSGVFSIAFFDASRGVAVGGDYTAPDNTAGIAAVTSDGGIHWRLPKDPPSGYRSAVAAVHGSTACLAVGRNGSDISQDAGETWHRLSEAPFQAIGIAPSGVAGWAVGADGKIARLAMTHAMPDSDHK